MMEVIGRASFNFKGCGPGRVASLLIGATPEVNLTIASKNVDHQRSSWKLEISNQESGKKEVISTSFSLHEDLKYAAKYPGTYEITRAQGDHCQGIVLSPETCKVVEQPLPQINVTWEELHEW
jgi:nucleoporin POM152